MTVFIVERESKYSEEEISDVFISLRRVRFGVCAFDGTGGSARPLFSPVFADGLETLTFFAEIGIFSSFADSGFGLGLGLGFD